MKFPENFNLEESDIETHLGKLQWALLKLQVEIKGLKDFITNLPEPKDKE